VDKVFHTQYIAPPLQQSIQTHLSGLVKRTGKSRELLDCSAFGAVNQES
jgi:hypothetical protein